ncbi:MAG: hypothetical protein ACN4GR_12480 [Arenicellales bacterium]
MSGGSQNSTTQTFVAIIGLIGILGGKQGKATSDGRWDWAVYLDADRSTL